MVLEKSIELKTSIRPTVVFDGGNRTIQWVDPLGVVRQIPSYIKSVDPTWIDRPDSNSVVIQSEGETFVLGQLAKDMQGIPTFQQDKVQLACKLALAALEPQPGSDAVRVERLLVAVPNSLNQAEVAHLKAIEGTHEFTRNGQPVIAHVRSVVPVDETRAAYNLAVQQGLFFSKKNPNAVMDLGGGTSILRLYSPTGALLREADLILPGTFDLARRISSRIAREFANTPSLPLVMDGIEAGDFLLGTTGYDFHGAFELSRDEWLAEIRGQIKTRWSQWLPSLGEVLIIGGSAPLAKPLQDSTKGRFKIAPNSQTVSIVGMLGL